MNSFHILPVAQTDVTTVTTVHSTVLQLGISSQPVALWVGGTTPVFTLYWYLDLVSFPHLPMVNPRVHG